MDKCYEGGSEEHYVSPAMATPVRQNDPWPTDVIIDKYHAGCRPPQIHSTPLPFSSHKATVQSR